MHSPITLTINSLHHPEPVCIKCLLDKTRVELIKIPLFCFELTQEPQNTLPRNPNKGECSEYLLILCLHSALTSMWPFKECCLLPLAPMNYEFNFSCGLLLNCSSPSSILCFT